MLEVGAERPRELLVRRELALSHLDLARQLAHDGRRFARVAGDVPVRTCGERGGSRGKVKWKGRRF
jgi:hypothetical protein